MKNILTITAFFITHTILFSQIPTYDWAYSIGDVGQENLDALITDSENNIIIGGQMYSTTDMDPTEFSEILYQIGQQDAFIEKFDADGNVSWGVNFGGPAYDGIYKMTVDNADNIYAIGYYGYSAGTIDLNPDIVDQDLVVAHGGYDMFITKFNGDGEYIWGHGIGAVEDDWINNITIDDAGNIYITGQFKGTVDFDGTEAGILEINSTFDKYDGFLAKYNADGEISWAFRIGGVDDDFANEVAVDAAGNILVTGTFQGTGDFYGQLLTAADGTMIGWPKEGDAFIAKYNSDADLIWAKSIYGDDGFNGGYSNTVQALAIDDANNIYVTGVIYGEGDFDMEAGENMIETYSDYDSYFAKYSPDGNFIWAHTTAPKVIGYNLDMIIDAQQDIYLTGDFNYSSGSPYEADFDFNPDSIYALQAKGEKDIYIAKYDSSAELIWAFNLGGSGWDFATAIALDNDFNICVGGWFFDSDDFDANPDSNFIWLPYTAPAYGNNIWMGKYHQDGITPVLLNELDAADQKFVIYPNPAVDKLNISIIDNKNETIKLYSITGKLIYQIPFTNELNISDLPVGMYLIEINNEIQKFIKL